MKDFLKNLVSRSLGTMPVIQPRVPSLFEPPIAYDGSFGETWRERDAGGLEAVAISSSQDNGIEGAELNAAAEPGRGNSRRPLAAAEGRRLPPSELRSGEEKGPDPRHPAGVSPLRTTMDESGLEPEHDLTSALVEPLRKMPFQSSLAKRNAGVRSVAQDSQLNVRHFFEETEERLGPAPHQAEAPRDKFVYARVEPREAAVPSLEETTAATKPPKTTTPAEAPRAKSTSPSLARVEPRAVQRFDFRRYIPPALPRPVEPSVQVTIGRVEVRAVPAQSSKRPESLTSPVTSLNDYLRQRSKRSDA